MLYRAICTSDHTNAPAFDAVAFVDASNVDDAARTLRTAVAACWGVPAASVALYNVSSESDLLAQAVGHPRTGDARLFELASVAGRPLYTRRAPVFLLPEHLQSRMLSAWAAVRMPRAVYQLAPLYACQPLAVRSL